LTGSYLPHVMLYDPLFTNHQKFHSGGRDFNLIQFCEI